MHTPNHTALSEQKRDLSAASVHVLIVGISRFRFLITDCQSPQAGTG